MKKLLLSAILISSAATVFGVTPKRLASMTDVEYGRSEATVFNYDADGRLEKVVDSSSTITIDYSNLSVGEITITYVDKYGSDNNTTVVTLNDIGLASTAVESNAYGVSTIYNFDYADGKLSKVTSKNGNDTEFIDISWNGNVIQSYKETESWDNDVTTTTFTYSGVENTGRLALYDELYGIDIDDVEYIAQGGFLGTIPLELPTGVTEIDSDDVETVSANWTLDAEGYPVKVNNPRTPNEFTEFAWEGTTGIDSVAIDANAPAEYFTIDGRRVENPDDGIFIMRKGNTSEKVLIE